MLFNSLPFLYGFLPVTYLVFWRLRSKRSRYAWLTLTGYVFYSFWDYRFCALMATSTLVSYLAGLGLRAWDDSRRRRLCLIAPVTIDLCLLGFFKYAGFAMANANRLGELLHLPIYLSGPTIILPVGISFYTFHTITYIVDSYRRAITPTRNLLEFSCYVSLFSQLVAGPIVRFSQIERDLENIDHGDRGQGWARGWSLFALGMIKKVLIADTIAAAINPALAQYATLSTGGAWLCMLGYAYQIYFDFSGYSLRDYLYIPLGGNRGPRWLTYRNLMITMLLGGLWHGASWTFVAWGGYHGALLAAYRLGGRRYWDPLPASVRRAGTFFLVVVGWVFFRASSFSMAASLLGTMFSWTAAPGAWGAGVGVGGLLLLVAVTIAALVAHVGANTSELRHEWRPLASTALAALFVLCLVVIYGGPRMPFLYFQF